VTAQSSSTTEESVLLSARRPSGEREFLSLLAFRPVSLAAPAVFRLPPSFGLFIYASSNSHVLR
jgi:hypothetical protein